MFQGSVANMLQEATLEGHNSKLDQVLSGDPYQLAYGSLFV